MAEQMIISAEKLATDIRLKVVDTDDFNERVIREYNLGTAEKKRCPPTITRSRAASSLQGPERCAI